MYIRKWLHSTIGKRPSEGRKARQMKYMSFYDTLQREKKQRMLVARLLEGWVAGRLRAKWYWRRLAWLEKNKTELSQFCV